MGSSRGRTLLACRRRDAVDDHDHDAHALTEATRSLGLGKAERLLTYAKAMLLPTTVLAAIEAPKGDPFTDLATIMFSSGSTGEPKGVMLSHHNVISNLEAIGQILGATREDRVMGVLPFFHAFGFTGTSARGRQPLAAETRSPAGTDRCAAGSS